MRGEGERSEHEHDEVSWCEDGVELLSVEPKSSSGSFQCRVEFWFMVLASYYPLGK